MAANNIYIQVSLNSQGAQQNVNALNQAIGQTGPVAQKSSAQATQGFNSVGVSISQVNREFSNLQNAIAGLGIIRVVQGMVQLSAELSRSRLAMQTFTGSAQTAKEVFEEVRKVAAGSPFEFKDLEKQAQRLVGFGMAAKTVPGILKTITDQVALMGGEILDVNTIVNLFGRIMEKNFVAAMDLMRALPAKGVPVMKAMADQMSKELGRAVDAEEVKKAIKDGIFDPLQTIRVVLQAMEGDSSKVTDDMARRLKNLGDSIKYAVGELTGPEGFGPAFTKLADKVGELLAPLAGLVDLLMHLNPETKEMIVNVTAGAIAFVAFGTALKIVTTLASPLKTLAGSLLTFTGTLVLMNPELAAAAALFGTIVTAAYLLIPKFKEAVGLMMDLAGDKMKGATATIKSVLGGLAEEGKKFVADLFKGGPKIDPKSLLNTQDLFEELEKQEQAHANSAQRSLLEALASPVEAIKLKYGTLFAEMDEKAKSLDQSQKDALEQILTGAEAIESAGVEFKENKKRMDEIARYQVERAKGAADAQIAYIEAQDAQDLRSKVRAIDLIAERRIEVAQQVAKIESDSLQKEFDTFVEMANRYRAEFTKAGVNVDDMIAAHQQELVTKQGAFAQKAFDEEQKARLEGWKKANDVIIADQKRVYDAFKSEFDQLFDVFMDRTKSLGQALGDFFKKFALGEAKELFSGAMAGAATQAAGYGRPEEGIGKGGILGTLLRRGMPPRPPLNPPEVQQMGASVSTMQPTMETTAHRFEIVANINDDSSTRFARAVGHFEAVVESKGEAHREMGADEGDAVSSAFQAASGATGVSQTMLRAVAQAESSMNPRAVSNKGAMGLMQLMPRTAAGLGVTQPFDVGQNVMGGAQQLQMLMQHYKGDVPAALAAYNMGEHAYNERIASGQPLPRETVKHVTRVSGLMAAAAKEAGADLPSYFGLQPEEQRWFSGGNNYGLTPGAESMARAAAGPPSDFGGVYVPSGLPDFGNQEPAPSGYGKSYMDFNKSGYSASWSSAPEAALFTGGANYGPGMVTPGGISMARAAAGPAAAALGLGVATPLLGGALKAAGVIGKDGNLGTTLDPSKLAQFFGIYGKGGTGVASILTSQAAGTLATMAGMGLAAKGLQQHYAPATTIGGGLAGAGMFLANPSMLARASEMPGGAGLGIGAAAATGVGLGLFASGFQKGGGAGLAMDIAGGTLAGAGIGTMIAPGLGTAIGAGIGFVAGAITGAVRLFVKTEQERIRAGIKQVYGLDISNRQILTQIQQIIDQKYGGSVSIGIRSQEVQDIVRLYALSTGQAAGLPRPMYNATIAQSQAGGLATQPVYQGGVLVQNPYTGPTTYQYQTAVTNAQGLLGGTSLGVPGAGGIAGNIFMQLNPQQANDLFTGRVVQAVQQNPAAVASANANGTRAGDSRVTQASNMLEPLTSLG